MKIDIDDLLFRLFSAQYKRNGEDNRWKTYSFDVISSDNHGIIENTVREWYNDQLSEHDARIAELEAKVRVYEEIIAKSNFAPFLISNAKNEEGEDEKNKN